MKKIVIVLSLILLTAWIHSKIPKNEKIQVETIASDGDAAPISHTALILGPFRGLLSSALWWRINREQEKVNFSEVAQLGRWLSLLQPQNGYVWKYQAQNLTYNITAQYPDPPTRWQWVRRGLRLLLEEGILYAPKSEVICDEISTILLGKCSGGFGDESAQYYMERFSEEMSKIFMTGDREEIRSFITAESPLFREALTPVAAHIEKLTGLSLWNPEIFADPATAAQLIRLELLPPPEILARFELWHRLQILRNEWKINPRRLLKIDEDYGSFDWRMPMGYAVYWRAELPFETYIHMPVTYRPEIRTAMRMSFENGRRLGHSGSGLPFLTTSDYRIIGRLQTAINALPLSDTQVVAAEYKNQFLREAAATLFLNNQRDSARAIYRGLVPSESRNELSFDTFIVQSMTRMLRGASTYRSRKILAESALTQSVAAELANDPDLAAGCLKLAQMAWLRNQKEADGAPDLLLPPFAQMRRTAIDSLHSQWGLQKESQFSGKK